MKEKKRENLGKVKCSHKGGKNDINIMKLMKKNSRKQLQFFSLLFPPVLLGELREKSLLHNLPFPRTRNLALITVFLLHIKATRW